nr:uncharacterized protein LOC113735440 [Coffea arabica]
MEQQGILRPPRPLAGDKNQRDQGLYCAYHRDVGHDTEDCRHLKKEIEKLIRRGHLGQGTCGGDSHTARRNNRPSPSGESSNKRLKMYEEIIYGPEDAVPLASNNHEAIVIEVITCNYKVKKVYIDNGSAIDVLYYKTFKELQLEDKQLILVRTPLIGFAGPPVRPEGMITLMVTVGE